MVQRLSLESCVEFLENRRGRPFSEVVELMREADVFVYPAVREAGGAVVVEAMASGLPCAVADYGGPATLITPECGVKVPLTTREARVAGLARELERLASDPMLREQMVQLRGGEPNATSPGVRKRGRLWRPTAGCSARDKTSRITTRW